MILINGGKRGFLVWIDPAVLRNILEVSDRQGKSRVKEKPGRHTILELQNRRPSPFLLL